MGIGSRNSFIDMEQDDILEGFRMPRIRRRSRVMSKTSRKVKRHSPRARISKKRASRRGIHYTKNGQPYKILANGRARFVRRKK